MYVVSNPLVEGISPMSRKHRKTFYNLEITTGKNKKPTAELVDDPEI